ncbi:MAG: hypothetical protein H0U40_00295 [Chloroflexia bacterium]|nr:hypothetical protein [Chloroflexia bacterium]
MANEIELVLALLATMTALVGLAGRVGLPSPIVLAIAGLIIGVVPGLPRVALDPDLVLLVFIPPILFEAAY